MKGQRSIMFRMKVLACVFAAAVPAGAAWGQPRAKGAETPAAVTAKASPAFDRQRFDALRSEGFDALYNLDYEAARRRFKELVRLFPDHPAGTQFLAATLWVQTLNESRRLQASLYNTEAFYAKSQEKTDPRIVAEFRELTETAKRLAQARLARDPRDVEALYFLGATEGLKAAFAGAVERSFMSALSDGRESVSKHRDVLKLDPNYVDAQVTLGMYDYVVATLPLIVKLPAAIGGIRGSKKRGLATLAKVAKEGRFAQDDARTLLIALLKREKRFAEALTYARELAAKYPRNYLFKLEVADALVSKAAQERAANPQAAAEAEREAFQIFDDLLKPAAGAAPARRGAAPPQSALARQADQIHFSYGQALSVAGQSERAAREYLACANVTGAEAGLATMARLRAAQSFDLANKRAEALEQYKAVLARPNIYDSHEEARRGLREPFKRSDADRPAATSAPDDTANADGEN
ncbi:MAG TPA: hypothetical protein VER08_05365 [Pyrinomonadaceae bacterium]|nr:hypothetical protein [Pyrinomonadaceae bacterium]